MAVLITVGFLINSYKSYGQYSSSDYELVKTTYTREFSKEILSEYITSQSPQKTIAALLSISQSRDFSLLPFVLNAEFNKYGDYVTFALGQIGRNEKSISLLTGKIFSGDNPFTRETFEAFGKISERNEIEKVVESYDEMTDTQRIGICLAIANFSQRGNKIDDYKFTHVLSRELENKDPRRRFEALYTIYRSGGSNKINPQIIELFGKERPSEYYTMNIVYALSCLRITDTFPDDFNIAQKYLIHDNWNIRCEAARAVPYYNFTSTKQLAKYTALLKDKNPNVARQAAVSLKLVKLNEYIQPYILQLFEEYLSSSKVSFNVKGELFVTYCTLFPDKTYELVEKYSSNVGSEFVYRVLTNYTEQPNFNFDYLLSRITDAPNTELMNLYPALLTLQKDFYYNEKFAGIIITALDSKFPPVVSLIADGIDSTFSARYATRLREIITQQVTVNLNDPDYVDALPSLERLAEKISRSYNREICNEMFNSKTFSVASYAASKLNKTESLSAKSDNNFNKLWEYACKYSRAIIKTNKGEFTIKFHPGFAPISVGNFCKLASEDFFDNTLFHRVVPNFVIQSGDPTGTGWGGPGYEIVSEFSPLPYNESYVGMASSGKDTEGSQWFVMTADYPHLNGRYSNFGKVVNEMNVANNIDQYDKVIDIKLIR